MITLLLSIIFTSKTIKVVKDVTAKNIKSNMNIIILKKMSKMLKAIINTLISVIKTFLYYIIL